MFNVALMGLGMVAATHAAAIAATGGRIVLKGVCSTTPTKADAFAQGYRESHGLARPKTYLDVEEIAADPSIDFVIVCTPPNARQGIVDVLSAAGKPILMEKPIERTLEAAERIVTTCKNASVPLGMVLQHRMREASLLLTRLLREDHFGKPAVAEISVLWWRPQSYYDEPGRGTLARDGGGVLISQAIHTMDLALSLMGPVRTVQAMARTTSLHQMETEDFVTAGLEFANGAVGSLIASTASFPGAAESIVLHCERASVALHSGQLHITWRDGRTETMGQAASTGGGADPMAFTHAWHQGIIEDFASALEQGRPPSVSGQDALAVHRLIDATIRSSNERRMITISEGE